MALVPVNSGFTVETLERLQKTKCAPCRGAGTISNGIRITGERVRMNCPQCAGRGYVYRELHEPVRLRV
jgi:DnaJ-class molecular chaperone